MIETEKKVEDEKTLKKTQEAQAEKKRVERKGIIHIYTSFNNTIVHITDMSGRTVAKITGGEVTKHDRLKANPTIAMFVAKRAAEQAKEIGLTSLYVKIRAKTGSTAPGPGAHAVIKSFSREGFKILSITDATKIARGGPKKKGGRRGRRV